MLAFALLVLVFDRVLKQWALLSPHASTVTINPRYFFWIEIGYPFSHWVAVVFFLAACAAVLAIWRRLDCEQRKNASAAIILFLGGSASNVIDRTFYGGAIDLIPLFSLSLINIADAAIVVGAAILISMLCRRKYTQVLS